MALYNISAICKMTNSSPATIYRHIKAGKIPYHRIGKKILFTDSDFEAYMQSCAVPAKAAAHE